APDEPDVLRGIADFYCRTDAFEKAEPILQEVLLPAGEAPPELLVWARRQLALGLARRAGDGDFEHALALLDGNRESVGQLLEDQRLRAYVLSTRPARRAEAVRLFEQT